MSKFCGLIGYYSQSETAPGVWTDEIIERYYYGDVIKDTRRYSKTDNVSDELTVNNQISILSDPYAMSNYAHIRYVTFMGVKWKVSNIDISYPRLILTLGGVYNGQ